MNFWQVFSLAVIQGLTEFLPISSSGHLVVLQKFFGFSEPIVAFDVLLHLGSLVAILFFFRKQVKELVFNWQENSRIILLIILGSIPAGLVGFFLKKPLERFFSSIQLLAFSYLVTSLLLFSVKFIKGKERGSLKEISLFQALVVGLCQALAVLPGISRSGATIISGLWLGLSAKTSFVFSFLLAVPAIIGASFLELPAMAKQAGGCGLALLGMMTSAVTSFLAIAALERVLQTRKLPLFGWYCLILSFYLFLQ